MCKRVVDEKKKETRTYRATALIAWSQQSPREVLFEGRTVSVNSNFWKEANSSRAASWSLRSQHKQPLQGGLVETQGQGPMTSEGCQVWVSCVATTVGEKKMSELSPTLEALSGQEKRQMRSRQHIYQQVKPSGNHLKYLLGYSSCSSNKCWELYVPARRGK